MQIVRVRNTKIVGFLLRYLENDLYVIQTIQGTEEVHFGIDLITMKGVQD